MSRCKCACTIRSVSPIRSATRGARRRGRGTPRVVSGDDGGGAAVERVGERRPGSRCAERARPPPGSARRGGRASARRGALPRGARAAWPGARRPRRASAASPSSSSGTSRSSSPGPHKHVLRRSPPPRGRARVAGRGVARSRRHRGRPPWLPECSPPVPPPRRARAEARSASSRRRRARESSASTRSRYRRAASS